MKGQDPLATAQLEEKGVQALCVSLTVLLDITNQHEGLQGTAQKFTESAWK